MVLGRVAHLGGSTVSKREDLFATYSELVYQTIGYINNIKYLYYIALVLSS